MSGVLCVMKLSSKQLLFKLSVVPNNYVVWSLHQT